MCSIPTPNRRSRMRATSRTRTTTEPTDDRSLASDSSPRTEADVRPRSDGRPPERRALLVRSGGLQSESGADGRRSDRDAGGPAEVFEMGRINREVHLRADAQL